MPGLEEDGFPQTVELTTPSPMVEALNDPSSIHPSYDPDSVNAPLGKLDARFGVEGVDFGAPKPIEDEVASVGAEVKNVLSSAWQPEAPAAPSESTALSGTPPEDEPIRSGLA